MLGGPVFRQHVVEFIPGVGVKLDGIVIDSTLGPWSWTVPAGVSRLLTDMCGPGYSGHGGGTANAFMGGGGGGAASPCLIGIPVSVTPGASLSITIGASSPVGVAGSTASVGGGTTLSGILPIGFATNGALSVTPQPGGGTAGASSATGGAAGGNASLPGGGMGTVPGGGVGSDGSVPADCLFFPMFGGMLVYSAGGSGAGSGATATTKGGKGGDPTQGNRIGLNLMGAVYQTGGAGTTTGSASAGGGGAGASSAFGAGASGGAGGAAGGNSTSYGAGGGGGGGGMSGGTGGPGYVRFTYEGAD